MLIDKDLKKKDFRALTGVSANTVSKLVNWENVIMDVIENYLNSYGKEADGMESLLTFLNSESDMRFDQDGNIDWNAVYSLYGSTLLGMLITDQFIFLSRLEM